MIFIGENIHVISKDVRNALLNKDEEFIINLINLQSNVDFVDLNVGPAKGGLENIFSWLTGIVKNNSKLGISFDTSNFSEMKKGLENFEGKTFINSANGNLDRLELFADLAVEHDSNLICLTMNSELGIPKFADGRLEIAFEIYEKCIEKGVDNSKIFFDPLILPVSVDQGQAVEALNTIKMIKESFDPPVKTVVGLSNISNGSPSELRPLINRVFAVLAFGAGLDAAIIDAKDLELIRIIKMLEMGKPQNLQDETYFKLAQAIQEFSDINDIKGDDKILKTAKILLNEEVYSHSFTQI